MQSLDRLYLEDPTRGMRNELRKMGIRAGRDYTRTLMQRMRIKTGYCRPRIMYLSSILFACPFMVRNFVTTSIYLADVHKNVPSLYNYRQELKLKMTWG
jgi:hypothetical protein